MVEFSLVPHPDHLPSKVTAVIVTVDTDVDDAMLTWLIHGETALKVCPPASRARADDLWRTTCFELFLRPIDGVGYVEFNFSLSGQWAAYAFDGYRAGMRELALTVPPHIERHDDGWLVDVDLIELPPVVLEMGLSAVIEETDGTKSYWALHHAPGPPDFHNRDCFVARLPAPERP